MKKNNKYKSRGKDFILSKLFLTAWVPVCQHYFYFCAHFSVRWHTSQIGNFHVHFLIFMFMSNRNAHRNPVTWKNTIGHRFGSLFLFERPFS